jgi:hypothetical protein
MSMRLATVLGLGFAALGCGSRNVGTPGDGGVLTGRVTFDVVATLTSMAGPKEMIPATNRFAIALDAEARRIVAGAAGRASVLPVTTTDGRAFRVTGDLLVGGPDSRLTGIAYRAIEFTATSTSLRGHASGAVTVSCGDCLFDVPFTAELYGAPDVTEPFFVGQSSFTLDPFTDFSVSASEPLDPSSRARLVGNDGFTVELDPVLADPTTPGAIPLIVAFSKPHVVLGLGGGYAVETGRLVDLAGHAGSPDTPLRLGTFPPPPLVAADGFESVTSTKLGGGAVVTAGDLTPITGQRSIYLTDANGPGANLFGTSSLFLVRMAKPPGAAALKFSYLVASRFEGAGFFGQVGLGSVGKTALVSSDAIKPPTKQSSRTWSDGGTVFISDLKTASLDLPPDVTDEVVVGITIPGGGGGLVPPAGLLVDDLRLE